MQPIESAVFAATGKDRRANGKEVNSGELEPASGSRQYVREAEKELFSARDKLHTCGMFLATTDNPYTVLTLIAAPAVFTNAASILTLGTGNRLARVVDRTRVIAQELRSGQARGEGVQLWKSHLDRLERRGGLLLRAMRFFYGAIGAFAAASLVSVLGASLAASQYRTPFAAFAAMSFIAGAIGFVGLVVGCVFLVTETRLALQSMYEEAQLARVTASSK
jgi:hypothetical protein